MQKIDKIALVDAAFAGKPVERIPFSLWYHFPPDAVRSKACAAAHIDHYRLYDLDYIKVMNDNPYDMPASMPFVELAKDYLKLEPLAADALGFVYQLEALQEMKKQIGSEVRFAVTIFGPFATANKISRQRAVEHLREDPDAFEHGMSVVAKSLSTFAVKALDAGASGIFLAASGAEPSMLSREEYARFIKPYDVEVLAAVNSAPLNILHVHGTNIYLDLFFDYPKAALNWPCHHSDWPVATVRKATDRCLIAGIDERGPFAQGKMRATIAQMNETLSESGREKFMFGSECTIPPETPEEFIHATRDLAAQV